jgi:hypothetical protein
VQQVNAQPWEAAAWHGQTPLWLVPLLVRRSGEQRDAAMPGLRGAAAASPAETSMILCPGRPTGSEKSPMPPSHDKP